MRRRIVVGGGAAVLVLLVLLAPLAPAAAGQAATVARPLDADECVDLTVTGDLTWTVRRGPLVAWWTGVRLDDAFVRFEVAAACADDVQGVYVAVGEGSDVGTGELQGGHGDDMPSWSFEFHPDARGVAGIGFGPGADGVPRGALPGAVALPELPTGFGATRADGARCMRVPVVLQVVRDVPGGGKGSSGVSYGRADRVERPVEVCAS